MVNDKLPPDRMMRKGHHYVRLPFGELGYKHLLSDQLIQAGDVCIRGTRIPACVVHAFHMGGDSKKLLMENYGITSDQFDACIEYMEGKL